MPSQALAKYGTIVKPTITLASLANGAGRISSVVDNTTVRAAMAMVFLRIKTGGVAPTANTAIKLYVIRRSNDGTTDLADHALGTADAAVTTEPTDAEQVGSIVVPATANLSRERAFLVYDLPAKYSFVVWNATGQSLSATGTDFELQVVPVTMEAQ